MNCPVCKINLDFSVSEMEEFYYDCSQCGASLLFKQGECEILSKGSTEDPKKSQEEVFEGEDYSKASPEEALEEEIPPTEEEPMEEQGEEPENEEEGFTPDEVTQVPEWNMPEEESSLEPPVEEEEDLEKPEALEEEVREEEITFTPEPSIEEEEEVLEKKESVPFVEEEPPAEQTSSLDETGDVDSKKEDFSDVAEFGNSQNQDKQGVFLYDLILSEINSQGLREQVLSVLEDESLNLPLENENQTIKDGQALIEKISPLQTYVIVTNLMGLPLKISWRQHHIADS